MLPVTNLTARELTERDVLVARDRTRTFAVLSVVKSNTAVEITTDAGVHTLEPTHGVIVLDRFECDGCSGDGVHHGRGYVENGVFHGHTGVCFRCHGKGTQSRADQERNTYYDNQVRRVHA